MNAACWQARGSDPHTVQQLQDMQALFVMFYPEELFAAWHWLTAVPLLLLQASSRPYRNARLLAISSQVQDPHLRTLPTKADHVQGLL